MCAGLVLRVAAPGVVQYGPDEAAATALALQISHGVNFYAMGILTSFDFHNPPLFLYLLAPLTWLSVDPRVLGFFFALAGTAAILLALKPPESTK